MSRASLESRFWAKVDKSGDCWVWTASKDHFGYGIIRSPIPRTKRVHRLSWTLHNGPVPQGMCVLHRCDNPGCVNPNHLFLGTVADNNADKMAKGRHYTGDQSGERNPQSKLNEEVVRGIRARYASGAPQAELARHYGVAQSVISRVVNRRLWGHVE